MSYYTLKLDFPVEDLKLTSIYKNPKLSSFTRRLLDSDKVRTVFGEDLHFADEHTDRPWLFGSFVQSVDGRITFPDDPSGPLVAQKNAYDPSGGLLDFWILNVLRASCDGTMGSAAGWTLDRESSDNYDDVGADLEGEGMIFDDDLEQSRIAMGRKSIPDNIITSLDCSEVDFRHPLWNNAADICITLCTSPAGYAHFKQNCRGKFYLVTPENAAQRGEGIAVVVTGENTYPNAAETMRMLKQMGYNRILVESPAYTNHLLVNGLLDELFLNTSGVYVGGSGLALGQGGQSATVQNHPHAELLSMHSHSPFFFYYRYLFHHTPPK